MTSTRLTGLSAHEIALLDLERTWWQQPGPKDALVRERLGLSPTHYYRELADLLDRPEALAHDPLVVRRLRRLRDERRERAAARRRHPSHPGHRASD